MNIKGDIYFNLGGHRVKATVTEMEFVGTRTDENGIPATISFGEEQDFDTYAGALLVEDKLNVRLFDQLAHEYTNEDLEETFVVTYNPLNAARQTEPKAVKEFDSPQFPETEDEAVKENPLDLISDEGNESDDLTKPLSDEDAAKIDEALHVDAKKKDKSKKK